MLPTTYASIHNSQPMPAGEPTHSPASKQYFPRIRTQPAKPKATRAFVNEFRIASATSQRHAPAGLYDQRMSDTTPGGNICKQSWPRNTLPGLRQKVQDLEMAGWMPLRFHPIETGRKRFGIGNQGSHSNRRCATHRDRYLSHWRQIISLDERYMSCGFWNSSSSIFAIDENHSSPRRRQTFQVPMISSKGVMPAAPSRNNGMRADAGSRTSHIPVQCPEQAISA